MQVYVMPAKEDWICDRFVKEWKERNADITTEDPRQADIIWLLADWNWKHLPVEQLATKRVLTSVHHLVPQKFDNASMHDFIARHQVTTVYHTPCMLTRDQVMSVYDLTHEHPQLESLTIKPVVHHPFWVNDKLWYRLPGDPKDLRKKYGIDRDAFLVGSFQRDTEGKDLISPKLEKGPDRFCDAVIEMNKRKPNVQVLLAGWRRQYVMKRLKEAGIKFYYHELPPTETINEFYNMLDLYVVAARYEGGPQSIMECGLTKTPIISTPVGLAPEILAPESVGDDLLSLRPNTLAAYRNAERFTIPRGFNWFRRVLEDMMTQHLPAQH